MNQETNKQNNQKNMNSSSNVDDMQTEKKYAFNQAEVNAENKTMAGAEGQQGQQGTNNQWQQGHPGMNGQWQQGHPGMNGQWQQGQPGMNNQWQQGQPGMNNQWQQQQYQKNQENGNGPMPNQFKLFGEQPVKVPVIKNDQDARNVFYGMNQPYYNKAYGQYKQGKKIGWNWSAFIFGSYWFFSRKMYMLGALLSVMSALIDTVLLQVADSLTDVRMVAIALPWLLMELAIHVAVGMFGNYMYMAHMESKIVYPSDKKGSTEEITKWNVVRGGISIYGIIVAYASYSLLLSLAQYIAISL